MIRNTNFLVTDDHGKELPEEGPQLFDLFANDGDIHQFAAGHIPSHWHKELEIFLLLEGSIRLGAGDRVYRLQAGDGCFINTGVIHSFTAAVPSPCTYRSFVFGPDLVAGAPGSIFDTAYVRPLLESGVPFLKFQTETEDGDYLEQFQRAFSACLEEGDGYEFQVRDALSHILLYVRAKSQTAPARLVPSVREMRLKEMLLWIDGRLSENISVSDIAGAANICPRECQRIFQRYLHVSPIGYVRQKRLFAAAEQLSSTGRPITDIALNCGFSNPSYFSRQFKEFMGSTPGEYRAIAKTAIPAAASIQ